jgi:hypothetical protein
MANIQAIGFIKLHRGISEHWIYPNHRKLSRFEAWIDLLLMANYAERKTELNGRVVTIKAGEILCSQFNLALRWMWGHKEARNFLQLLQKDGMILIKPEKKWTLLTICNWDVYQVIGQTKDKQKTNNGQTDGKQRATLKEGKESKEGEEDGNTFIPPLQDEVTSYFEENGYTKESGLKAFNYYDVAGWKDSRGNKVKNWKQKMQSVWFKDENKKTAHKPVLGLADGGIVQ